MPAGNLIYKVGRTTGFKIGQRGQTCMNENIGMNASKYLDPPPSNTVLLCQYRTTQTVNGSGDSGGPVFFWDGFLPAKAKFAGIFWGGDPQTQITTYSPVSGIHADLGTLRYTLQ
jgi:hypothetical protein